MLETAGKETYLSQTPPHTLYVLSTMGLHDQCQVLGGLSFFNSRFSLDRTLAVTPYLLPLLDVYLLTPEKFVESDMGGGSVVQMKLYYESV